MCDSESVQPKTRDKSTGAPEQSPPDNEQFNRDERRYAVSNQRGQASGKVRYIEGNTPNKGCRFL